MKKYLKILLFAFGLVLLISGGKYAYDMYQEKQDAVDEILTVACMGDSNTYRYGGNEVNEYKYSYHLAQLLGDRYKVKNYGMPGTCVQSDLASPYTDTRAYKAGVEVQADIIVIMLGTNDIWDPGWRNEETFYQHYISLIDSYLETEKEPEIYLCTVPELFLIDKDNIWGVARDRADQINAVIRRIAEERNYPLIEVHETTLMHPEWYEEDEIHLNPTGAEGVAALVYDALDKE